MGDCGSCVVYEFPGIRGGWKFNLLEVSQLVIAITKRKEQFYVENRMEYETKDVLAFLS